MSQEAGTSTNNNSSRLVNILQSVCGCFNHGRRRQSLNSVHAVDSVRLVYRRQIEEATEDYISNSTRAHLMPDELNSPVNNKRRGRQYTDRSTILALENALRQYETKNHAIISNTKVPETTSFTRGSRISRSSQADAADILEELFNNMIEPRASISIENEVEKHVTIYEPDNDDMSSIHEYDDII